MTQILLPDNNDGSSSFLPHLNSTFLESANCAAPQGAPISCNLSLRKLGFSVRREDGRKPNSHTLKTREDEKVAD
jgi:hypothetical protein